MSEEKIENITKSDSNFVLTFVDLCLLPDINFNVYYFIKKKKLFISYKLHPKLRDLNIDFTLNNCLFGFVKLTKNANLNKCKYSGYSIGFDSRSKFAFTDGSFEKNGITFGANISSSVHIDNKNKDILILGEGSTQGLNDTTLTAEAKYPVNFTESGKRFVLSLHYNGNNSFLYVNATKIYQFKIFRNILQLTI